MIITTMKLPIYSRLILNHLHTQQQYYDDDGCDNDNNDDEVTHQL